jgi:Integrase core domain
MGIHANAKLGPAGRRELVRLIREGSTGRQAAAAAICCISTPRPTAAFSRPGHGVTGERHRTADERRQAVGYDYAHACVDDHSRLAFAQICDDERANSVPGFVVATLSFGERHGITVRRILTDNTWTYSKNRALAELLTRRGIEHWTTQPYRPRTNGKVERFHQTMAREWAYGPTTDQAPTAATHCHTGSSTTTSADPTAPSTAGHPSAALTTSQGRITSRTPQRLIARTACCGARRSKTGTVSLALRSAARGDEAGGTPLTLGADVHAARRPRARSVLRPRLRRLCSRSAIGPLQPRRN